MVDNRYPTAEDTAHLVFRFLNIAHTGDITTFLSIMEREHRTIQQVFTGMCLAWIVRNSDMAINRWDARNEDSVAWCHKIIQALPDLPTRLPFI